jgi:hypothetical protein
MQAHDILIRRQTAVTTSRDAAREFFTLHRYPTGECLGGPWDDEHFARAKGLERGEADHGDVWLETSCGSGTFQLISE